MHIHSHFFSSLRIFNQRVKRELKGNKVLSIALMSLCALPSLKLVYDLCIPQKTPNPQEKDTDSFHSHASNPSKKSKATSEDNNKGVQNESQKPQSMGEMGLTDPLSSQDFLKVKPAKLISSEDEQAFLSTIKQLETSTLWNEEVQRWLLQFLDGNLSQELTQSVVDVVEKSGVLSISESQFKEDFLFFKILAEKNLVKPYYSLIHHLESKNSLEGFSKKIPTLKNITNLPHKIQFLFHVATLKGKKKKDALDTLLKLNLQEANKYKACIVRYYYKDLHKYSLADPSIRFRKDFIKEVRKYVDCLFSLNDFKTAYTLLRGDLKNSTHQNGVVFTKAVKNAPEEQDRYQVREIGVPEVSALDFFFLKLAMLQLYKREAWEEEPSETLKQERKNLLISLKLYVWSHLKDKCLKDIKEPINRARAFEALFDLIQTEEVGKEEKNLYFSILNKTQEETGMIGALKAKLQIKCKTSNAKGNSYTIERDEPWDRAMIK